MITHGVFYFYSHRNIRQRSLQAISLMSITAYLFFAKLTTTPW